MPTKVHVWGHKRKTRSGKTIYIPPHTRNKPGKK